MALIGTQLDAQLADADRAWHADARSEPRRAGAGARRHRVEVRRARHRLRRCTPRHGRRNTWRRRCGWCASIPARRASAARSGRPVRRAVTEFSDGFPILVISRASLADLNSRLPQALPMERFRPNVVIDGVEAYDEDRIHELRAGPVTLRIVKPCTRCSITTTDQQKGAVRWRRAAADAQGISLRPGAARRDVRAERDRRGGSRRAPAGRPALRHQPGNNGVPV